LTRQIFLAGFQRAALVQEMFRSSDDRAPNFRPQALTNARRRPAVHANTLERWFGDPLFPFVPLKENYWQWH